MIGRSGEGTRKMALSKASFLVVPFTEPRTKLKMLSASTCPLAVECPRPTIEERAEGFWVPMWRLIARRLQWSIRGERARKGQGAGCKGQRVLSWLALMLDVLPLLWEAVGPTRSSPALLSVQVCFNECRPLAPDPRPPPGRRWVS